MISKIIFQIQVHCEWNEWKIGECDKSCGGGFRTNTRTVKVDAKHGGEVCAGSSTITESCNVQECPGKIFYISNSLVHLTSIIRLSVELI